MPLTLTCQAVRIACLWLGITSPLYPAHPGATAHNPTLGTCNNDIISQSVKKYQYSSLNIRPNQCTSIEKYLEQSVFLDFFLDFFLEVLLVRLQLLQQRDVLIPVRQR